MRTTPFEGLALGLAAAALAAGCASTTPAPVTDRAAAGPRAERFGQQGIGKDAYTVKKGDSLYGISRALGQEARDIAAWNNLDPSAPLRIGQVLRTSPPDGATAVVVKPVTSLAEVEARPLGGSDATPLPPLANPAPATGDGVKREPKAGKQPYSETALAALRKAETEPPRSAEPLPPAVAPETKADPKADPKTDATAAKPAEGAKAPETGSGIDWQWPVSGKVLRPFSEPSSKGLDIAGRAGDPVLAAAAGKVMYVGSGIRGYGNLVIIKHSNGYLSAYGHNRKILVKENQAVTRGQKIAEMGDSDADQPKLHFEIRRQGKPTDPMKHLPAR